MDSQPYLYLHLLYATITENPHTVKMYMTGSGTPSKNTFLSNISNTGHTNSVKKRTNTTVPFDRIMEINLKALRLRFNTTVSELAHVAFRGTRRKISPPMKNFSFLFCGHPSFLKPCLRKYKSKTFDNFSNIFH